MQKITPFLWFDGDAEEAAQFYTSVFEDSKIVSVMPGQGGKAAGITFTISGQTFMVLNGGPQFHFTEAISLFVSCATQAEVDMYWEKLSAGGGAPGQCGWLKDKYGLSWQIIPTVLTDLMGGSDRERAGRVMQAMLAMTKIDIATLESA